MNATNPEILTFHLVYKMGAGHLGHYRRTVLPCPELEALAHHVQAGKDTMECVSASPIKVLVSEDDHRWMIDQIKSHVPGCDSVVLRVWLANVRVEPDPALNGKGIIELHGADDRKLVVAWSNPSTVAC